MAIDSRFGGASHDSFIWSQSVEKTVLATLPGSWLLGKSIFFI